MSFCITKDYNLPKSTLQFLYDEDSKEDFTDTFGGILSNSSYAWIARKSKFLVVNCKNGLRVGTWNFSNSLQDDTALINAVEEIQRPNGKEPHLIISVNCQTKGGIICLFDYVGSKVIRAIQVEEQISNIHVVDREQDLFTLSGPLRNFDGVLAVGTVGGNVYILDICRQLCYEGFNSLIAHDELNPCQIQIITSRHLRDLENHKKIAVCKNAHLAIYLNVVHNRKTEHFVLKSPEGKDRLHVNKDEVLISSLHYCPQLCSILVGYNFGAYQLWNLMSMELVYTSQICEGNIPITKFAIQEPADDPRAFCYVWVVYSTEDFESNVLPFMVMFALCYETKEYHENYGYLYQNFQSCTIRFQRELGFGNNQSVVRPLGGKCLKLDSLSLKNLNANNEMCSSDGIEDVLSLCVTAWKALCEDGLYTYMSVFDLNQWYKAQMPNSSNFDDCASYMITLCISELIVSNNENPMEILDLILHKKTIEQFVGTQRLEEHYYPSSLSFETSCLLEHKIVNIQYQGVQRALLCQLQTSGPLCLIRPSDMYQEIVSVGLTPLFIESNNSPITSLNNQREVILNVALEQQLTSWLCKCASEWANGSFSSAGCSLDLLTTWAFRRAFTLKRKCDYLCVPLFDYSDDRLDANAVNTLNNCIRQIKNISFVFSFILSKLSSYLTNKDTVTEHSENLQMVEVYFEVLQWFFNVGLLPECVPHGDNQVMHDNRIRIPYLAKELAELYMKTRSELMLSVNKKFASKNSVLFIDNLITVECGGDRLEKDWKKDGGDGFYPPRSLQALLRTYLIGGIDVSYKHAVIIYLLLDLAVVLDTQYKQFVTHFFKFPSVFKVNPSFIKITQGFWYLDHGQFHIAMEHLIDPLVNHNDLKNWHHKVVMKSLLVQEQHNLALLYMNIRKPPILDDEDVLCALSLYISNNMLDEAFYLEKNFKDFTNSKKIIKHLFTECSNYGRLHSIINRNLTDDEEALFLQYLDEVKHPEAADLKITYFMQRSHYIEAFKTYKACEDDPMKKGLLSRLNLKARDQIVHSYKKFLPTVSYQFIESCTTEPNPTLWKEVSRPDPMSVCVKKREGRTEYKSSLILAALAKAKLTFNDHKNSLLNATTEEIPFLRTPTVMPKKKRSSVQVIVPKMLETTADQEEDGPSPPKRSKLSFSHSELSETNADSAASILSTPIISRKSRSFKTPGEKKTLDITSTPTSILKVRNSNFLNISSPNASGSSLTPLRSTEHKSVISGRKSTRTSMVRFDVPSTSSEEPSSSSKTKSPSKRSRISEISESISNSRSLTSKSTSDTDEIYYSPNSSLNNIDELPKDKSEEEKKGNEEDEPEFTLRLSPVKPAVVGQAERVRLVDYDPSSSSSKDGTDSSTPATPRARKSYRRLSSDLIPVRSSPRLSRSSGVDRERGGSDLLVLKEETTPLLSSAKGKSRKSLNQKLSEANTLARLSSSSVETTKMTYKEEKVVSGMVEKNEKTETTIKKHSYSFTTIDSDCGGNILQSAGDRGAQVLSMEDQNDDLCKSGHMETCDDVIVDNGDRKEKSFNVTDSSTSFTSADVRHSEISERERSLTQLKERSPFTSSTIKPRKSLNRRVLESNTLARFASDCDGTSMNVFKSKEKADDNSDSNNSVLDSGKNCRVEPSDSGTSDSFIELLYNDLRKRERETCHQRVTSGSENENSDEKSSSTIKEQSNVITTRRFSRRLSQERNLGSDKVIEREIKTDKRDSTDYIRAQTRSSLILSAATSTPELTEENQEEKSTGLDASLAAEEKNEELAVSNSDTEVLETPPINEPDISTPSSSAKGRLKVNQSSKKIVPLSRKALENNALMRISSAYDAASNEDAENSEEVVESDVNAGSDNDSQLSDSLLDAVAFGMIPKEKELLEECRKSIFPNTDPESTGSASNNDTVQHEETAIRSSEPVSISDSHTIVLEISDDVVNQEILETFNPKLDTIFESDDQSRQENVSPTVFEKNITSSYENSNDSSNYSSEKSDSEMKIIEISSSDEMNSESAGVPSPKDEIEASEMIYGDLTDDIDAESESRESLNKGMLAEDISLSVYDHTSDEKQPTVISIMESIDVDELPCNKEEEINTQTELMSQDEKPNKSTKSEKGDVNDQKDKKQVVSETENKPVQRMTRRLSKQLDNEENKSILLEDEIQKNINTDNNSGSQIGISEDKNIRTESVRKRTRSVDMPPKSEETKEDTSKAPLLRAKRKLRSASVDIPSAIEEEVVKEPPKVGKQRKKPSSLSGVDSVKEDKKRNKTTSTAIKEDLIENLKTTRRLTRRQHNVLEKSLDKIDLSIIEHCDPIELLNKPEFEGAPDPQEQKVYETSPTSTGSPSRSKKGRPAKRLSRASSNASDESVVSTKSTSSRRKSSVAGSPKVTRTRRSLRSSSIELDTKSTGQAKEIIPDVSDESAESDTSLISTKSGQSTSEDPNNAMKRKRKLGSRSKLPKIKEENSENISGSPAQNTRRGRKSIQK